MESKYNNNRLFTLTILFHTLLFNCYGQSKDTLVITEIIDPLIEVPIFPGGPNQLYCFLDKNLNKGITAKSKSGMAIAEYTIDMNGMARDAKIIKSLNPAIDSELIRIIQIMPKWTPVRKEGKTSSMKMRLPLKIPYKNKFCR